MVKEKYLHKRSERNRVIKNLNTRVYESAQTTSECSIYTMRIVNLYFIRMCI